MLIQGNLQAQAQADSDFTALKTALSALKQKQAAKQQQLGAARAGRARSEGEAVVAGVRAGGGRQPQSHSGGGVAAAGGALNGTGGSAVAQRPPSSEGAGDGGATAGDGGA